MNTNVIYHNDCFDVFDKTPDKSVDVILCDLPFGTTDCTWDIPLNLKKLWISYNRIIKKNGIIILFGVEPFSSEVRLSNKKGYKYDLVWQKERLTNVFQVKKRFGMIHENIMLFYYKQPTYNPQMEKRDNTTVGIFSETKPSKTHKNQKYKYSETYDKTMKYPTTVLKFNRDTLKGAIHPTQKPVALLEYLIKTFSNEGDLILDNTAGSMSLAVACDNTNRNWICIENVETFCIDGLKRVNENRKRLNKSETFIEEI